MIVPTINKQKQRELLAQAHGLNPVVQIGSQGLTKAVMQEIDRSLRAHELIKVQVMGHDKPQRLSMQVAICEQLFCVAIASIGKLLILYRESQDVPSKAVPYSNPKKGLVTKKIRVFKPNHKSTRTHKLVTVLGNQRLTAGGSVKRAKVRRVSTKKYL